jgi:hypothetical protein
MVSALTIVGMRDTATIEVSFATMKKSQMNGA